MVITAPPITYGGSSGFGITSRSGVGASTVPADASSPFVVAQTQPAFIQTGNNFTSPTTNSTTPQTVGSPTNVQATPGAGASLLNYLVSIVTDPFNHILAVIVLLLLGHYFWKHFISKLI